MLIVAAVGLLLQASASFLQVGLTQLYSGLAFLGALLLVSRRDFNPQLSRFITAAAPRRAREERFTG